MKIPSASGKLAEILRRWQCARRTHVVLFVLLVAAAFASVMFAAGNYRTSTIVIEAGVPASRLVQVQLEDEQGEIRTAAVKIDAAAGGKSRLVFELPASKPKTIRIGPLADKGRAEIDWISYGNHWFRYTWSGGGNCSQLVHGPQGLREEVCQGEYPQLSLTADEGMIITAIPGQGFTSPMRIRLLLAISGLTALLAGLFWLLLPTGKVLPRERLKCYAQRALWLLVALLYLRQFYFICRYATDLPFQDEWLFFRPDALPGGLSIDWLLTAQFGHIILPTKLLVWLDWKLFNLDFSLLVKLNYLLFGLLLLALSGLKNRIVGKDSFLLFPAFMIFLVSTLPHENHFWGYQSQIHLFLLFFVLSLYSAYRESMGFTSALFCALPLAAGCLSFSGGLAVAAVFVLGTSIYTFAIMAGGRMSPGKGWRFLVPVWLVVVIALLLVLGGQRPDSGTPFLYPWDQRFWDYFFNILGLGFGFTNRQALPGLLCSAVIVIPLAVLLWKREERWKSSTWMILTSVAAILAVLLLITAGRGVVGEPKLSRYAEIGLPLIPCTALAWWLVLKRATVWRTVVLTVIWGICFITVLDEWSPQIYREMYQDDLSNLACIARYYQGIGNGICEFHQLPADLDQARRMRVNFYRQFERQ